MFDLQDILRSALDGMRDGMSVGRAENQRPKHQHVQRSLEHFAFEGRLASWHLAQYTPPDHRPEASARLYIATIIYFEIYPKSIEWRKRQFMFPDGIRARQAVGRRGALFIVEIQRVFDCPEIRNYLGHLERTSSHSSESAAPRSLGILSGKIANSY